MNKASLKTLIRNMNKSETYSCYIRSISDTVTTFKMRTDKGSVTAYVYGVNDTTVEVKMRNDKASGAIISADYYKFHTRCTYFISHLQQRIEAQLEIEANQDDDIPF